MFNLVPFAGARRKVTDGNRKTRFIRKLLLELAEFTANSVSSPPPPDGGDREDPRVMIHPHIHEPRIPREVVNAIRVGAGNVRRRKVVPVYFDRLLCRKPLFVAIIIVPERTL